MEGTRLRILQLLQKNGSDTVEGLSRRIGLAPATIRRHLDILQRDRLVTFQEVRKRTGRPEYSFHLTEQGQEALPKGYDRLLGMIVQELSLLTPQEVGSQSGPDILKLVFQRLSSQVFREYESQVSGQDLEHRLATLVELLSDADFFPEVEVGDTAIRIRLLNCPFRSVALQNRAVCSFDSNLISALLKVQPSRDECIHDGATGCTYTTAISVHMSGKGLIPQARVSS